MAVFSRKSKTKSEAPRRRRPVESAERPQQEFKRGRTMAGSTSHTLRTSQAHALQAATPREKVHHLSHMRRKLTVFLVSSLVGIICIAIFLQQFTASVLVSFDDVPHDAAMAARYERSIQNYLSRNPLERLRFNLNEARLTQHVQNEYAEVREVKSRGFEALVTTEFEVSVREPVVSWQVDDVVYYVDADGVSFARNYYSEPQVKIVDNSGVDYTTGTAIASERFLRFVGQAVAQAKARDIIVTEVSIPAGTSRQAALTIEGRPYQVIMSIDRSIGEQVEDMANALGFFDTMNWRPTYIDLRVKGKAFFREQ